MTPTWSQISRATRAAAAAAAAVTAAAGGVLDGVVTCAGTSVPGVLMVHVNFFGTTELVAALQPALAASSAPRVAVVGSISGTHPTDEAVVSACLEGDEAVAVRAAEDAIADRRAQQLYPSSKFALARWARRTAIEPGWASAGIPLNVVAPGVVLTPMTEDLMADPAMKEVMDAAVPMPLNGYLRAEDVAQVLAFPVSPENSHITGRVIYVDGGAEVTLR
ncbi:SDR family oxidoreductase [Nocardioides sp. B-3]|uniref:SDR family oxidoreductase n=1 Tax=Nocardioides sp. B-3 TaxID=2895565 RepID=UPI0021539506|nr:SDR family oxidoreductase [Nocardioides sp. B-3]UUZ59431.1 SDR family oxidoreductase [Nocardioides sp. B-3]